MMTVNQSEQIFGLDCRVVSCIDRVSGDHPSELVSELAQADSYVFHFAHHYLLKKRYQVSELCVILIGRPRFNEDARVLLKQEIFCEIINDDRFVQRSADFGQVFDDDWEGVGLRPVYCVLAIQTVSDQLVVRI